MTEFIQGHLSLVIGILFILLVIAIILLLLNLVQTSSLREKYDFFMRGKTGRSIEDSVAECMDEVARVDRDYQQLSRYARDVIERKADASLFKHYMRRYDAFEGLGGELSFVLVLLDEKNSGYLLNSVQGRDSAHMYLKNIDNGVCRQRLAPEEEQALQETLDYWKAKGNNV